MVLNNSQKCIFSCDNRSCVNNSPETFKNIICPFHLSQVFGLKIKFHVFEDESKSTYFGPFLIVDDKLSFDEKTIIFPTRDLIDQHLGSKAITPDFFNYKINPRLHSYLNNLISNQAKLSESESRYQLEIIRNLFVIKPAEAPPATPSQKITSKIEQDINLFKDTEASQKTLNVKVSQRIHEMNKIIVTEDYETVFDKIQIMTVTSDTALELNTFTPFMRFILFNCLTDEHKLPQQTTDGIGITTYANLFYKEGYGFVTTTKICNPSYLCVFGTTTGTNNFYQLKTRVFNNRTVQNTSVHIKDLPDNLRPSNILNIERNFCWNR